MRFSLSLLLCLFTTLFAQEITINPPNPAVNGLFGARAAAVGDRLFINELGANNFTGSVHIYRLAGGQPQFLQTLINPDGNGRNFGFALDAVRTEAGIFLAVGAAFNNVASPNRRGGTIPAGEVLIYLDSATDMEDTFSLLTRFDLSEFGQSNIGFGNTVDLNLVPGGFEIAVGATGFTNPVSQTQTGAVAIYTSADGTSWMRTQLIQPDNVTAGGEFGLGLKLNGDQLFVGASNDTVGMVQSGSAYLFTRSAQTKNLFQEIAKFQASDADTIPFGAFGEALTLLPDGTLVVSAPRAPANNIVPGKVYVFNSTGAQGDVTETQIINPNHPTDFGVFGIGLGSSDNRLFIGEPATPVNKRTNAGAIQQYDLVDNTWTLADTQTQGDPAQDAFFGDYVGILDVEDLEYLIGGAASRSTKTAAFSGQASLFPQQGAEPIFADGFESGNTLAWTNSVPIAPIEVTEGFKAGGSQLTVLRDARFKGAFGMQVPGDAGTAFVEHVAGEAVGQFRCRVQLRTNDLDLPSGNRLRVLAAGTVDGGTVPWLAVELLRDGEDLALQVLARDDNALMRMSDPVVLSDPWHGVEVALNPGDGDGAVSLRVNAQTVTVGSLINTGAAVAFMRIGVMPASTPATGLIRGSVFFDDFSAQAGGSVGNACLSEAEFRSFAADWNDNNILFLVGLRNLPCP